MPWTLDSITTKWLVGVSSSWDTIVCFILAVMCVSLATWWWKSVPSLPPGPRGLPVVGYLPWIDPKAPYETLSDLVDRYGKVFSLRMGSVLTVVIADPKVLKDVFSQKTTTARAPLFLTHGIFEGYGLICSDGALWRDHRKFILGFMRDQGMRAAVYRDNMEQRIHLVAKQLTEELSETGEPVEIAENLLHHVGNTMMALIFGKTYGEGDPIWRRQRYLLEEGTKYIGVAGPLNFLPWLRFLPMYRRVIKFIVDNHHRGHCQYQGLIDDNEASLTQTNHLNDSDLANMDQGSDHNLGKNSHMNDHFLASGDSDSIESIKEELERQDRISRGVNIDKELIPMNVVEAYVKERCERGDEVGNFTYKQIRHVCGDLFGAGSETTTTTLRWHLLNMALYPDVQARVQQELDEIVGGGADHAALDQAALLPFTQASIMETQRLRSIVPLGIPHGAGENLTIQGYHIPAGTMLLPLLWRIHRDPQVWEDPELYDPQRFLDEDGNILRNHPAFMPFQTGRRMCIGDEFAKMILFVFTTRILLQFTVKLGEDCEGDPAKDPICGITLTPRPCKLLFTPRRK